MRIDFASPEIEALPECDVVILGSGAAAFSMASELIASGNSVLLLEAGNEKSDQKALSEFYRSAYSGKHPNGYLYRRRMLGGTTSIWGGRCIPYDRSDFEPTEAGDGSTWPISYDEVAPFIDKATVWLEAGGDDNTSYQAAHAIADEPAQLFPCEADSVSLSEIERFSLPQNSWKSHGARLCDSNKMHIAYNCAARELVARNQSGRDYDIKAVSPKGKSVIVHCKTLIIAIGGLETARLLLASRGSSPRGVGNEHDLVGRYYQTHLIVDAGILEIHNKANVYPDYARDPNGVYVRRLIKLSETERNSRKLLNLIVRPDIPDVSDPTHSNGILSSVFIAKRFILPEYRRRLARSESGGAKQLIPHFGNILRSVPTLPMFAINWTQRRILANRKIPSLFIPGALRYPLQIVAEQAPLHRSRVTLDDECDAHGMPRIRIDWQTCEDDVQSIRASMGLLEAALAGNPHAELVVDEEDRVKMAKLAPQGGHHIGTTRMGTAPENSVTDEWGRIWSTDNVYVAGAALFPRSGAANPTLMLVALALRNARKIANRATKLG